MRKTLERIVSSALLLSSLAIGSYAQDKSDASSDDSKPRVVLKDDPELIKATEYYMPYSEIKRDIELKEEKSRISTLIYNGNGRGNTEVTAWVRTDGSNKRQKITLKGWNCGDGYLRCLDIVSYESSSDEDYEFVRERGEESYYQFCTSSEGGEELVEGHYPGEMITININDPDSNFKLKEVPKTDKEKYENAKRELDRWSKILDIDTYRKKTGWRSARNFFYILPIPFNDRECYDIYINKPRDREDERDLSLRREGEVWPNFMIADAKGNDSLRDITFRYDETTNSFTINFRWEIYRSNDGKSVFYAKLIDDNADNSLDRIVLGADELEVFGLKEGRAVSMGVTNPPYPQTELDYIFAKGKVLHDSASAVFKPEKDAIFSVVVR